MKVEILFPEICNIYGDFGNIMYLKQCLPNAEFIETELNAKPKFVEEDIDLVYLGSMTEKMQEKIVKKLEAYKDTIEKQINDGKAFLFTGNSFELLGKYIENEDGSKIECLGIIDIYSKREMFNRYNSLFLGEFEGIKIVGYKDQFAHQYGNNSDKYFAKVIRGIGLNRESKLEGIKINNFIGTSILGPILVLNPSFTEYLIKNVLKAEDGQVAFKEDAIAAYNKRLEEYEDLKRSL